MINAVKTSVVLHYEIYIFYNQDNRYRIFIQGRKIRKDSSAGRWGKVFSRIPFLLVWLEFRLFRRSWTFRLGSSVWRFICFSSNYVPFGVARILFCFARCENIWSWIPLQNTPDSMVSDSKQISAKHGEIKYNERHYYFRF